MSADVTLWCRQRELAAIETTPLLASWERHDHPAQARLRGYLDEVEAALAPALAADGPHYIHLQAAVPEGRDVLHHYDLENYLTPVAHRLRNCRVVLAPAEKGLGVNGRISAGLAEPDAGEALASWQKFRTRCVGSPQNAGWKERLRADLAGTGASVVPPGPVEMHMAWRCDAARRNWVRRPATHSARCSASRFRRTRSTRPTTASRNCRSTSRTMPQWGSMSMSRRGGGKHTMLTTVVAERGL